jgi:hypothetical protein
MAGIPDKCHRQQQARIMLTSAGDQLWAGEWRGATRCQWCKSIRTDVVSTWTCRSVGIISSSPN